MQLISVNQGRARTQLNGVKLETTGIYKDSTSGPVQIHPLGMKDDFICDMENHGGEDQAVYIYGAMDYSWWAEELGRELAPGTFGENLTISELESAKFNIGDRLQMGSVILEVSAPRIPCSTLATRMGDPKFVKRYRYAERPGLYCRVIQEGTVQIGDGVSITRNEGDTIPVLQMFRDHYVKNKSEETLRRTLNARIDIRSRRDYELDLQKLLEPAEAFKTN